MTEGYWVVTVDRESGQATTSRLFSDKDAAYQHALDAQTAEVCTVVARRIAASRRAVGYC